MSVSKYMSKFLKDSVDYSETDKIKQSILRPILEQYNSVLMSQNNIKTLLTQDDKVSYIINNNIKYYLLIIPKMSNSNSYHTCYFFPDKQSNHNNKDKSVYLSDFYMEIDQKSSFSNNVYLFEGYLYNHSSYYITDILYYKNQVIINDYMSRYNLINEIVYDNMYTLQNLNGFMNIKIHPILDNTSYFVIFQNNFVFKQDLVCIETVYHYKLAKTRNIYQNEKETCDTKGIIKGKYSDVYHVYNIQNNNNEGILYIKTLKDSLDILKLFENKTSDGIILNCEYNIQNKKWKPILSY